MTVYITRDEEVKSRAISEIQGLYKPMEIVIRDPRRSQAQSNYFHQLCGIIGDFTGAGKEIEKMRIKFQCLPLEQIHMPDGKTFLFPISESKTTKEQETQMIEMALATGMGLGLTMPLASFFGLEVA